MMSFPVPNLASLQAYRPTWFAKQLQEYDGPLRFGILLRQLEPDRYAALARATAPNPPKPLDCYIQVLEHLDGLFPVHPYAFSLVEEAEDLGVEGENFDFNPFFNSIPVDSVRQEPYEEELESPALALCWMFLEFANDYLDQAQYVNPQPCLKAWEALIPDWLTGVTRKNLGKPPRGREWRKPWQDLGALFSFACGITDCPFIDYTQTDLEEIVLPDWNLEQIRALEAEWKRGKTIMDRALSLANFIDSKPQERIPLLAGVLHGDKAAWSQITIPTKQTTLSYILTRGTA